MREQFQITKELLQSFCMKRSNSISHSYGIFAPCIPSRIMPDLTPVPRDREIAERLLCAYRKSKNVEKLRSCELDDIWSCIQSHQSTFFAILERGDPTLLASYLCNMNRYDATMGTVQGYLEYVKIRFNPLYRRFISLYIKDKLVSLAEAVGAMACENPEQGVWGKNLHTPIDEIVKAIERQIGFDITPPDIDGGLLKICGTSAQFHERDLNAIYTAWCLSNLLKTSDRSVCEIGAGAGRVAYWSWRFGIKSYSIIDLPHINVIQGFYLLKALPDAPIRLYGEPEITTQHDREITILPSHCIDNLSPHRFDLVLNQDSFPEIHAEIVRDYLMRIREISRKYFLSINHESSPKGGDFVQNRVRDIIDEVGGYEMLCRIPYWLRRGYVMELYEV